MILFDLKVAVLRYFGVFLFAVLALVPYGECLALDTKQLFKSSKGSVVLIMSFDESFKPLGYGSGFFVGNGNKIVTNYHVIKDGTYFWIKLNGGKVGTIKSIISYDKENDLALLESSYKGKPLPLAKGKAEVGEDIIAIGNPQGFVGTLSKGLVSGIREDANSYYYQITAPISPGSSGGPIINEHGEVIGVTTAFFKEGQNLNFAVPSIYIQTLLNNSFKRRPSEQISKTQKLENQASKPKLPAIEQNTPVQPPQEQDEKLNQGDALSKYVGEVYVKIFKNWKDPLGGGSGRVQVSFSIYPRGNISMPKILKSSGDPKLDNLAVRAVKNAVPLPPFPKEIKEPNLPLILKFDYVPSKG